MIGGKPLPFFSLFISKDSSKFTNRWIIVTTVVLLRFPVIFFCPKVRIICGGLDFFVVSKSSPENRLKKHKKGLVISLYLFFHSFFTVYFIR